MTDKYKDPMDDILDRPIAFNPAFKRITGSTVAALMLSQAWYWSKRTSDPDGWFFKTGAEWEDETGLTRNEQETARKHLREKDIVEELLRGVPATMNYRINKQRVYELLGVQFAGKQQTGLRGSSKQESANPANYNKKQENTQRIPAETPELVLPNIYIFYEKNIGMLTPVTAEFLDYWSSLVPERWIEDAIKIAVNSNARKNSYIQAILQRWQNEGKDDGLGNKNGNGHKQPVEDTWA